MARSWLAWQAAALLLLTACGSAPSAQQPPGTSNPLPDNASPSISATTPISGVHPIVPVPPPVAHQARWVDLQVGDCLGSPPPSDPSVVDVTLVDCAAQHAAEVFLRANVEVNDAIAAVAGKQCSAGLAHYTHQASRYTSTYLVDSNMDRTGHTPLPSTVICLLQSAGGEPLTGSARG
jgi:hypothetical protein